MQLKVQDSDIEMDEELDSDVEKQGSSTRGRLRNHRLPLTCICIDSQNEHAFTGSKDGSIIKWSLATRKILHKINPIKKKQAQADEQLQKRYHSSYINCLAISSDDKYLASGGGDPNIRIWSPKDMSWLHTFSMHRKEVTALAFRIGHHMLYSGSADRSVMLWTLEDDDNRCFVEALYGHESEITSMDALHKERALTSGGRDQTIRIWKIVEQAQTVFQSKHQSVDVARYVDDKTFVSGGEDGSITLWTTMKRSPLCTVSKAHGFGEGSRTTNGDCPFSKNLSFWISSLAVLAFKQKKIQTATANPNKRARFDKDLEGVTNNDDDVGSSSGEGGDSDGEEKARSNCASTIEAPSDCLALIASGSCDSQLHIWKLKKSKGKHELTIHQTIECPGFINDLRFTNDGSKILAACGQEHRFGRWWRIKRAKNCMRIFDVNKVA